MELTQKSDTWTTTVDSPDLTDLPDTNPGDGVSVAITGERTLRAAVIESNTSPGIDVVQLGAGVYQLSTLGDFEDAARTGDLDVTGELTIRGLGAGVTIIDGGLLDRVFHVHTGARLTLQNMTIRNGRRLRGWWHFQCGYAEPSECERDLQHRRQPGWRHLQHWHHHGKRGVNL
ncbi:MAG UNVERIFIED_CONTAM: hypothetical protein LVR18_38330 [Planctomycetaceae bacterium]